MLPTRRTEDLLLGSWKLLQQLGRVPRRLIWNNKAGIGRGKPAGGWCSGVRRHGRDPDCVQLANQRIVRTIKARPVELIDVDRAPMLPLPPIPPDGGWRHRIRLGRDYYVRTAANDYSVGPWSSLRTLCPVANRAAPASGQPTARV